MHVLIGTSDGPIQEGGALHVTAAVLSDDGQPFDVAPLSVAVAFYDEDGAVVAGGGAMTRVDEDAGQATAGGAATLTDAMQVWRVETWRGAIMQLTAGTGAGQVRRVAHNDEDTVTVEPMANGAYIGAWATPPDATTQYRLHRSHWTYAFTVPAGVAGSFLDVEVTVGDPGGGNVVRRARVIIAEA